MVAGNQEETVEHCMHDFMTVLLSCHEHVIRRLGLRK